jgi:hypothetical protein
VVGKFRERLAISKQAAQIFDGVRFDLRNLNELEVSKRYQIVITNIFAALGISSDDKDINIAWENINPLPVQFKSLLPGQEGCFFSVGI